MTAPAAPVTPETLTDAMVRQFRNTLTDEEATPRLVVAIRASLRIVERVGANRNRMRARRVVADAINARVKAGAK